MASVSATGDRGGAALMGLRREESETHYVALHKKVHQGTPKIEWLPS